MPVSGNSPPRLLIADDQADILEALRLLTRSEGYEVECVKTPAAALRAVEKKEFDIAVIDLNYARDTTGGREGMELLGSLREVAPFTPVVVMTAWSTVDLAVEAMRRGAADFVTKPWDNLRLLSILRTQVELSRTSRLNRRLEAENQSLRPASHELIAQSAAMQPVLEIIARVAGSDASVLITGENGTGKGLVARALHADSPRKSGPFVAVNTGGFAEGIYESELFGHVRGAFTDAKSDRAGRFEMADRGTLFLDEIGNVPLGQQAKLLRVIETGEFERVGSSRTLRSDVRLLTATNANLDDEVKSGRFRQDLLFRLNTIHIHLPPLRDRGDDVVLLANNFLRRHRERYRKSIEGLDPDAVQLLKQHTWPGNIRELDHAIERAVLLSSGSRLRAQDLGLNPGSTRSGNSLDEMSLEDVEVYLIKRTLSRCGGNARKAAEELGLSRSAFYRRLEKYRL